MRGPGTVPSLNVAATDGSLTPRCLPWAFGLAVDIGATCPGAAPLTQASRVAEPALSEIDERLFRSLSNSKHHSQVAWSLSENNYKLSTLLHVKLEGRCILVDYARIILRILAAAVGPLLLA